MNRIFVCWLLVVLALFMTQSTNAQENVDLSITPDTANRVVPVAVLGAERFTAADWSANGGYIAIAQGRTISIYATETFNTVFTLELPSSDVPIDYVTDVALNVDGSLLAVRAYSGVIFIYDMALNQVIFSVSAECTASFDGGWCPVSMSSDWRYVAAPDGNRVNIWEWQVSSVPRPLVHNGRVLDALFLPQQAGEYLLATASDDRGLRLWNAETGIALSGVTTERPVQRIAVSPDARTLVSTSRDYETIIWTQESGQFSLIRQVIGSGRPGWGIEPEANGYAFSSDSLALYSPFGGVWIKSPDANEPHWEQLLSSTGNSELIIEYQDSIDVELSPYDDYILYLTAANTIIRDTRLGGFWHLPALTSDSDITFTFYDHTRTHDVIFVRGVGEWRQCSLWEDACANSLLPPLARNRALHYRCPSSGFTAQYRMECDQFGVRIYDRQTNVLLLQGGVTRTDYFELSADQTHVVVGSVQCREPVKLYNLETGQLVRGLWGNNTDNSVAPDFSPDGGILAYVVDGDRATIDHGLILFDTQTGEVIRVISGFRTPIRFLSFSADGTQLFVQSLGIYALAVAPDIAPTAPPPDDDIPALQPPGYSPLC